MKYYDRFFIIRIFEEQEAYLKYGDLEIEVVIKKRSRVFDAGSRWRLMFTGWNEMRYSKRWRKRHYRRDKR